MTAFPNCRTKAAAGQAAVLSCAEIQSGIFRLVLDITSFIPAQGCRDSAEIPAKPAPGQFYMLRAKPSGVLLGRPVSIYNSTEKELTFLILKRGAGTAELCGLCTGDTVELTGPLGNIFPVPDTSIRKKTALIGGGIGTAPVAAFASQLPDTSYDFYACFRGSSYGLEHVKPEQLYITTEDGSEGTRGMLPVVFGAEKAASYSAIYACGPEPMLVYIQTICREAGISCYLSLEARMACGLGACLGCSIETTKGRKRCCANGPVFPAEEVLFR